MDIPKHISQYLNKNDLEKDKLYSVVTDIDGAVKDIGNVSDIVLAKPIIGKRIDEYLPVFLDVFPIKENLYLPNMRLTHGGMFNIHLILNKIDVWIFFEDVEMKIEAFKSKIIELKALHKREFQLLEAIGYLVLKKIGKSGYEVISKYPAWLYQLLTHKDDLVLHGVVEVFPFLDFFITMSDEEHINEEIKQNYSGIWTQSTNDGGEIHLNAWIFQIHDDSYLLIDRVESTVSSEQNIIQLARENSLAYEQLRKAKLELQDLVILKDKFVSIVSHDFRSPLSSIYDGIDFLNVDLDVGSVVDDDHRDIVSHLKSEISRLLDYNNKLYNWTKMNLENIEINETTFEMVLVLSDLSLKFDKRLKSKELKIKVDIVDDAMVKSDYVLLNQAISNIIDNAIKFSPHGSMITLQLTRNYLSIQDEGCGISEEKIEEILKGYNLKSTKGTNGEIGTGLGLNIVTRIISTLGFSLSIESDENIGTKFIISFNN